MGFGTRFTERFQPDVEQPTWAAALQELHDGDGIITVPGKESIKEGHPFVDGADLSVEKARTAFDYLEHAGLIEPVREEENSEFRISREGFHVANERQLNQRQWEIDLSAAIITVGLFVVTIINLMLNQTSGLYGLVGAVLIGALFIIFIRQIPRYG